MFERVEAARRLIAELIHASPDEIAFTRNISDGINALAQALPWQAGDNVVICEALEHPAHRVGGVCRDLRPRGVAGHHHEAGHEDCDDDREDPHGDDELDERHPRLPLLSL